MIREAVRMALAFAILWAALSLVALVAKFILADPILSVVFGIVASGGLLWFVWALWEAIIKERTK